MPPRVRTASGLLVVPMDDFLGMAPDQAGIEPPSNQFNRMENLYTDLRVIKKRLGVTKYGGITHATGSRVYGIYEPLGAASTPEFGIVKHTDDDLYFLNSSTWTQLTGFAIQTSNSYFGEINMLQTGASADVTDTAAASSSVTVINLTTGGLTPNAHVGKIVQVRHATGTPYRYEHKIIVGNTANTITVSSTEPLNEIPATGVGVRIYPTKVEMIVGVADTSTTGFYLKVSAPVAVAGIAGSSTATGMTRLDETVNTYGFGFRGIEIHQNRVFGWNNNRLRWSDLGNGEQFSKNNYLDFTTDIRRVKSFTDDIIIVYERSRVTAIRLSDPNPANWETKVLSPNEGCNFPNCVANYFSSNYGLQFFVSTGNEIKAIPSDIFTDRTREAKIFSVSKNYIATDLSTAFSCMEVNKDGHLIIAMTNSIWWRLNVEASERTKFAYWIWSKDTRSTSPMDLSSHVMVMCNGALVSGQRNTGQIDVLDAVGVYTDNGSAISTVLDKRSLQDSLFGDLCHFYTINIAHGVSGGSSLVYVYVVPDNTPAGSMGSSIASYNPSTGDKHREIRIPVSPSANKDRGKRLDFRFTEDGSVQMADIERIEISFYPGTYK